MVAGSSVVTAPGEHVVEGLRAAARMTGRSPSGIQRLVDAGKVPAERDGRTYMFRVVDLEAIRRSPGQSQASGVPITAVLASLPGPSAATAVDATKPVGGRPEIAAPANAGTTQNAQDDGAVAAVVFADFRAGKSIIDVVIDRRLPPDVVRRVHAEWVALSDVDVLRTPAAEARMTQVEADIQALDGRLSEIEVAVHEVSAQVARGRQEIDARLRTLSARSNGVSVPGAVYQRLGALEQRLAALPAAPLLVHDRRCTCGGPLIIAAACSACGLGRGAV